MKYIAKKINKDCYEIIGIDAMPTIKGKYVEVIVGKIKQSKQQLEQVIKDYEEETTFFIDKKIEEFKEQRQTQLDELKEHLKAIENCQE